MRRKQRTVLDHLIRELGAMAGLRTATFVAAWAIAERRKERPGRMRSLDYAAYWNCSEATVCREMTRFKAAFPMWSTPSDLAEYMRLQGVDPGPVGFGKVTWLPPVGSDEDEPIAVGQS